MTAIVASTIDTLSRHRATRPVACATMSAAKTVATGRWHWFSYDKRGWWQNRQAGAVFFSPTLHTSTLAGLSHEVDDYWCFRTPILPGQVVVDVGAGVGDHILVFSRRVGANGRVVAIEAHPATARCLQMTVATNRLANTTVIQEAAWDQDAVLHMSNDAIHERNAVDVVGEMTIRARAVDAMLQPFALETIHFLKMNIEGAEETALRGMPQTLARTKSVVVSCHDFLATPRPDDPLRTKTRVIAALQTAGFEITTRPEARAPWVQNYVYGERR